MGFIRNVKIVFRKQDDAVIEDQKFFEDVKKVELLNSGEAVLSILTKNRENYCYPLRNIHMYKVVEVPEENDMAIPRGNLSSISGSNAIMVDYKDPTSDYDRNTFVGLSGYYAEQH